MTEKQKKALTIAGFIIFLAVMGLVTWFVGRPLILRPCAAFSRTRNKET